MILKRIDQIILQFYPHLTRSKIQSLMEKGKVQVQGIKATKPGRKYDLESMSPSDVIIEEDEELHYVSRGALKLLKAIQTFEISVVDKTCLDVGLSTGGFSDVLLQKKARKVLGIDVGRDQLHESLREEERLIFYDKINAKEPLSSEILETFFATESVGFDLIVVDVSFISLSLIIPNLIQYLKETGQIIVLVKPQFEVSRSDLNKKGVVKKSCQIEEVKEKISRVFIENKLKIISSCPSPIEGENGNKEILMLAARS